MSFRARCLLGLDADLDSSFSFDLCIIGQQDVPNYSVVCFVIDQSIGPRQVRQAQAGKACAGR